LLTNVLRQMGFEVVPSEANFVMVPLDSAQVASRLTEELVRRGVIVRPLGAFGLPQCVRISTGTDDENQMLIGALEQLHLKEVLCR
jgi:histidinol-phosphate aminotransferase